MIPLGARSKSLHYKVIGGRGGWPVALVVSGRTNKQIAYELKLSEMTVKVHRSQIMRKMRAKSLIDLVRMADRLGVSAEKS